MSSVRDAFGRPLRDLRISVTDRCNFRCTYCMPKEVFARDYAALPRHALLSFEEITRAAGLLARLGVRKIRLTGGEPLVRRDIEHLVAMLSQIDGVDDLAMTTNGALLAAKADALAAAGLSRITVSLDSLESGRDADRRLCTAWERCDVCPYRVRLARVALRQRLPRHARQPDPTTEPTRRRIVCREPGSPRRTRWHHHWLHAHRDSPGGSWAIHRTPGSRCRRDCRRMGRSGRFRTRRLGWRRGRPHFLARWLVRSDDPP
jgi:hypothetical protein